MKVWMMMYVPNESMMIIIINLFELRTLHKLSQLRWGELFLKRICQKIYHPTFALTCLKTSPKRRAEMTQNIDLFMLCYQHRFELYFVLCM